MEGPNWYHWILRV